MRLHHLIVVLLYFSISSCSEKQANSTFIYEIRESQHPSLVASNDMFDNPIKTYDLELKSGDLKDGDYVWISSSINQISLSCDLFAEFVKLSNEDYTGEGEMIFSPFERFFILKNNNNKFYGISIKLSDNTIKIEQVFPLRSDNSRFRSTGDFESMTLADIEFIEKSYPCINELITSLYVSKK